MSERDDERRRASDLIDSVVGSGNPRLLSAICTSSVCPSSLAILEERQMIMTAGYMRASQPVPTASDPHQPYR